MPPAPTVLIADDDRLVCEMVSLACRQRGVEVVGYASCPDELLELCTRLRPDVAVVAESLGGVTVEAFFHELAHLQTRVVVLSADPSPERLASVLALGVFGYLSYDAGPDDVISGIVAVAAGAVALNPTVASTVLLQWRRLRAPASLSPPRWSALTPREHDVLVAITDGLAAKAVAARLGVALKTVENHKIRLFEKLGVRSQAQAVAVAVAHGLAEPSSPTTAAHVRGPVYEGPDALN
jgi:DNA-binding NarL/FixJ family response regulator